MLLLIYSLFILFSALPASAQSIVTLGEIRNTGVVSVKSSQGQWAPVPETYPLLQNSSIRTECGFSILHLRDGSRIDLHNDTTAVADGILSQYSLTLEKGTLLINMHGKAQLTVTTPKAVIFINRNGSFSVNGQKDRIFGVVSVTEGGTEVRGMSGAIQYQITGGTAETLQPGHGLFVDSRGRHTVEKTNLMVRKARDNAYRIKENDCLRVETPQFTEIDRVDAAGRITVQTVKGLKVDGLTFAEAEQTVAGALNFALDGTILTSQERCECLLPLSYAAGDPAAKRLAVGAYILGGTYIYFKGLASPWRF